MSEVIQMLVGKADLAYAYYTKNKGVEALIAWFRAELALEPQGAVHHAKCEDSVLRQHTNHVELLAMSWHSARHKAEAAAA